MFTNISFRNSDLIQFWSIAPNKIGKHAQVKHFPNRSAKHTRFTTDLNGKPSNKKPGISVRSSFLHRRSFKFQFVWQNDCVTTFPSPGCLKACWLTWFRQQAFETSLLQKSFILLCVIFLTYMCSPWLCSHYGWLLLKCSAIGIGFLK